MKLDRSLVLLRIVPPYPNKFDICWKKVLRARRHVSTFQPTAYIRSRRAAPVNSRDRPVDISASSVRRHEDDVATQRGTLPFAQSASSPRRRRRRRRRRYSLDGLPLPARPNLTASSARESNASERGSIDLVAIPGRSARKTRREFTPFVSYASWRQPGVSLGRIRTTSRSISFYVHRLITYMN